MKGVYVYTHGTNSHLKANGKMEENAGWMQKGTDRDLLGTSPALGQLFQVIKLDKSLCVTFFNLNFSCLFSFSLLGVQSS